MRKEKLRQRKIIVPAWVVTSIERRGDEFWVDVMIDVRRPILSGSMDWATPDDALEDFYAAPRRTRETSRELPHLRFCEATELAKLAEFVMEFGPVLGHFQGRGQTSGKRWFIQNVAVLTSQQAVFEAMLHLVSLLNELDELSRIIATRQSNRDGGEPRFRTPLSRIERDTLAQLRPAQKAVINAIRSAVEESARNNVDDRLEAIVRGLRDPHPDGDEVDILSTSHRLLCQVFNVFTPHLYYAEGVVQECPASDDSGIRPLLYFLLREVYLMKHRIRLCKRDDCGQFFIPDRGNGEFCSVACGTKVRQRLSNQRKRLLRQSSN